MEAKNVVKKFEIVDRVECIARTPAYITLKVHKENFSINPKRCLINPAKNELEKVGKTIEDKSVREK